MTHKEYRERLDKILLRYVSSEMNEMGVQQGAISKNELVFTLDEAKQAIDRLFLDVAGEDDIADLAVAAKILHPEKRAAYRRGIETRNELRQQLRTTITGKEGGE